MKAARDVGCTWIDVREALLVVSLFAGFPRTLDAFEAARAMWGDGGGPEPENVPVEGGLLLSPFRVRQVLIDGRTEGQARAVDFAEDL